MRPPGDPGRDGGTNVDAGMKQDAGVTPSGPILGRSAPSRYDCAESLSVQHFTDRSWASYGWTHRLLEKDGGFLFGRIERTGPPFGQPTSVDAIISTLDASGNFGTPTTLPFPTVEGVPSAHFGALGDVLFFVATDSAGANIVTVDGTDVAGPKPVIAIGGEPQRAEVITGAGRAAVLYATRALDEHISYLLQPIDTTGAPVGSPTEIVRAAERFYDPGAALVATESGWAAAWYETSAENVEVHFRTFAADGSPDGERKTIYSPSTADAGGVGFAGNRISMLEVDGSFIVAFTEADGDWQTQESWVMVRLAKLDPTGEVLDLAFLQDPELHFDWVEPELFLHNDTVALTWGRGEHIYICGGCVPNHSVDLVLLDPATLAPVSTPAKIENPELGGLLFRTTASDGTDILSVFRIVYHVHNEAGLAAFTCSPVN